jgi:hypothetical protein
MLFAERARPMHRQTESAASQRRLKFVNSSSCSRRARSPFSANNGEQARRLHESGRCPRGVKARAGIESAQTKTPPIASAGCE